MIYKVYSCVCDYSKQKLNEHFKTLGAMWTCIEGFYCTYHSFYKR